MKRNAFITAIAAMLVVLMFAGCQPNNPSGPIVLPGGGGGGGSSVLTADEKEAVSEAIEAIFTNMGPTISASQTGKVWESDVYTGAYNLTVENGGWTLEAWGKKTDPGAASSAARSIPEGSWDIIIETSSSAIAANSPIEVTLNGTKKNVPVSEVIDSSTTIPTVEGLIVNIRAAKHNEQNGFDDHDNWKFVGDITQENNGTITIQVNTKGMTPFESTESQGEANWIPVLISVDGVTDISKISWGQTEDQATALGQKDESDVEDMLDLEDQAPVAGEFVVWLKADPANPTNRVIKVGETSKSLSFNFVEAGIYPVMTEEELTDSELTGKFQTLFAMFQKPAHLRTLHRLEGYKDDTNSFAITGTKTTSNAISFDITFTDYAFDDDETYTMSGNATMTFSGTMNSTKLEASNWRIVSDQLTFASSDSSASYTAKAVDIGGQMVKDSAFGDTSATVDFEPVEGGYDITNIPEEDYATEATRICFGLKEFNTDSSAALVEINRTVTGVLINKYIEAMTSQQQSATFS